MSSFACFSRPTATRVYKTNAKIHHLALHLHVSLFAKILQQVTSFEVLVGVDNCLELVGRHNTLVLGLFDLCLVQVFKHPGQSN